MLYAAKCYWPGVRETDIDRIDPQSASIKGVTYAGALLFPEDELVLFVFDSTSRVAVRLMSEQVRIPCERVMQAIWFGSSRRGADRLNEIFR